MTAGGKLVLREFFGDHSTVKNVDSPSVVVLLCGSAIVSVLLAAAVDLVGMAAIPLCAYLASLIVPPVGVFVVRPLLHTGPTVLEGFAVGVARWAACTLAIGVLMMCMTLMCGCFLPGSSYD